MKPQVLKEETVGRKPSGLQDGGHVYLRCSNCNAVLMDIFRTRPHEAEVWKVQATCPFCGDRSFEVTLQGGFHPGGYGQLKEGSSDDDIPSTFCEWNGEIEGDTILFEVKKATADAKPLYRTPDQA